MPPLERVDVTEETKLVELCDEEYAGLVKCFTLPDGASMRVKHLKGFTKEDLMAFVKGEGGPHGLVPGWLMERGLEGYLKPAKKAKGGDSSGSGSSNASPGETHFFLAFSFLLVRAF
jgi:hypothetical protein